MTTAASDPLIDAYLKRLRATARALPRARRDELVEQIREHLDEAIAPGADELEVRNALERLGEPDGIVGEEIERLGIRPTRAGRLEWITVVLLPIGFVIIPFFGWILAIVLLWSSPVWSVRQKLMGTFLPPGGLSAILIAAVTGAQDCSNSESSSGGVQRTVEHCTGGVSTPVIAAILVAWLVAGIGTPILLGRRIAAARA